jgi:hypothetical protein
MTRIKSAEEKGVLRVVEDWRLRANSYCSRNISRKSTRYKKGIINYLFIEIKHI